MTKVMVVEDDNSLKEIYTIRLTAEGYEVVSAADGEEALAVAVREKPDLILSDVMMPKISGFDMLDILRQTPETKNIKVIMMTALSSDDQRARGENLGADKYLVKSQVGIEDVINAIHEVIGDKTIATPAEQAVETAAPAQPAPTTVTDQLSSVPPVATPASAPAGPETTPEPTAPAPVAEPANFPPTPAPGPTATTPTTVPISSTPAESNPVPGAQPAIPAPAPDIPAVPTIPPAPVEASTGSPAMPPVPTAQPVAPENETQNGIPQA